MKKVEAIIRPHALEKVKAALVETGILGLTATEVLGCGRLEGQAEAYYPHGESIKLIPKIQIFVVVTEDRLNEVVETIIEATRTGKPGDGKIFVSNIEEAYGIRLEISGSQVVQMV